MGRQIAGLGLYAAGIVWWTLWAIGDNLTARGYAADTPERGAATGLVFSFALAFFVAPALAIHLATLTLVGWRWRLPATWPPFLLAEAAALLLTLAGLTLAQQAAGREITWPALLAPLAGTALVFVPVAHLLGRRSAPPGV